jgi:type II secretory pathway pseudopilin PulG
VRASGVGGAGRESEQGFLLVGVIVMVALVLLVLSIAAPIVAKDLRRERELEAVHRGQQYTRAIRLFYLKFNTYPASMEALEKTNNIRYLRQRYVDPMTGKPDWRLIHFGQAKTTVKGFFGEPLAGLAGGGSLGSASGLASSQQPGQSSFGGSSFGGQSGIQSAQGGVGNAGGSATGGTGAAGTTGTGSGTDSGSSSFGSSSFGSNSGSGGAGSSGFGSSSSSSGGSSGTSGPFVGVGIPKEGASIIDLNEQTDYSTWEFIYDPRIEQLYSKVSIFGGGPASTSSGSLGSASSLSGSGTGTGFGSSSFGNSGGGSFGNSGTSGSSGSGSGSGSGTGGTTNPTTPSPQQ